MLSLTPIVLAALLPFSVSAVSVERQIQARDTCFDVYLFLANGFKEPVPGRVDAILSDVCNGLPSCSGEDIKWDLTRTYCGQLSQGVSNGKGQINAYAQQCPKSKIVLVGYSLGAQVVGDILGGTNSDSFYGCTESASAALGDASNQISAAVMLGNPKHVANQVYNYGDGNAKNGQYPRSGNELAGLNRFSCLLQDICELDDPICALGDNGLDHEKYIIHYGVEATAFIRGKLSEGGSGSGSCGKVASSSVVLPSTAVSSSTPSGSSIPVGNYSIGASSYAPSTTPVVTATYTPIALSNTAGPTPTYTPSTFSASTTNWATNLPTAVLSVFTAAASASASVPASNSTIVLPTSTSTPTPVGPATNGGYQNGANLALGFMSVLAIKLLL